MMRKRQCHVLWSVAWLRDSLRTNISHHLEHLALNIQCSIKPETKVRSYVKYSLFLPDLVIRKLA